MRGLCLPALLASAFLLAPRAFSDDPPAPAQPPAPKPTRLPEAPKVPGIHWEADFEAGMRRAAVEGRLVFFAVNALEDQPGGDFFSPEEGLAARPFVSFVGNEKDHGAKTWPDGTRVCAKYGIGTCKAHQEALAFVGARLSADGSLISPSHWVLDPDGGLVWHGDYVQSRPSPGDLDGYAARVSPRLVMRGIWTARDEKTTALSKAPTDGLEKAAAEWLASSDALAPAGVVAMLDQESDPKRRAALFAALATAGARAVPLVFDAVDEATASDGATDQARWIETALRLDDAFGGWALSRALLRAKGPRLADVARGKEPLVVGAAPAAFDGRPDAVRGRLAEALLFLGDKGMAAKLEAAQGSGVPRTRVARALRKAGLLLPVDLAAAMKSASRDERRVALLLADAAAVTAAKPAVVAAFADPAEEVRVAAAIALRRAGDGRGADVLLAVLSDPVEGPEARAALLAIAGRDVGEDPAAWEEFLRAGGGK